MPPKGYSILKQIGSCEYMLWLQQHTPLMIMSTIVWLKVHCAKWHQKDVLGPTMHNTDNLFRGYRYILVTSTYTQSLPVLLLLLCELSHFLCGPNL